MIFLIRLTVLLAAGLLLRAAVGRRRPERRALVAQLTLLSALALPVLSWLAPPIELAVLPPPVAMSFEEAAPQASATEPVWPRIWLIGSVSGVALLAATGLWVKVRLRGARRTEETRPAVWQDNVEMPFAFGFGRGRIYVPLTFLQWPEAQRRPVLAHEGAHLERFDCAWRWVANLACAVYWCHPLVWWLSVGLRDDAELAADERAIRSGVSAVDYAATLVTIAQQAKRRGLVRSLGVTFMNKHSLSARVERVLSLPPRAAERGFGTVATFGIAAVVLGLAGLVGVVQAVPQQNKSVPGKPIEVRRPEPAKVKPRVGAVKAIEVRKGERLQVTGSKNTYDVSLSADGKWRVIRRDGKTYVVPVSAKLKKGEWIMVKPNAKKEGPAPGKREGIYWKEVPIRKNPQAEKQWRVLPAPEGARQAERDRAMREIQVKKKLSKASKVAKPAKADKAAKADKKDMALKSKDGKSLGQLNSGADRVQQLNQLPIVGADIHRTEG